MGEKRLGLRYAGNDWSEWRHTRVNTQGGMQRGKKREETMGGNAARIQSEIRWVMKKDILKERVFLMVFG